MPIGLTTPPPDIGTNPGHLYQWARDAFFAIQESSKAIEDLKRQLAERASPVGPQQLRQIRDAMEASGPFPLDLTGLTGKASSPQLAAPVVGVSLADLNARFPASHFLLGTLAVTTTAPAYTVYFVDKDANGVHKWTALVGIPANMAKTDADNAFSAVQSFPAQFRSKAHNSGSLTIANNTVTALTFDTNDYDTGGVHSTSVNTSRFTVPAGGGGTWMIVGLCSWGNSAAGDREIRIRKNGATNLANFNNSPGATGNSSILVVAIDSGAIATDYYELIVIQTSGGNLGTLFGAGYTEGQAYKLG